MTLDELKAQREKLQQEREAISKMLSDHNKLMAINYIQIRRAIEDNWLSERNLKRNQEIDYYCRNDNKAYRGIISDFVFVNYEITDVIITLLTSKREIGNRKKTVNHLYFKKK